jgi:hypothetical protein
MTSGQHHMATCSPGLIRPDLPYTRAGPTSGPCVRPGEAAGWGALVYLAERTVRFDGQSANAHWRSTTRTLMSNAPQCLKLNWAIF